jgi:predicted ATPase
MRLKSIAYSQFKGERGEWKLKELTLGPINLLVGKNASGKSRMLNIIGNLGNLLAGDLKPAYRSGNYNVTFEHGGKVLKYILVYRDSLVLKEEFTLDGKKVVERGHGGRGKILFQRTKRWVEFQTPQNELAAVARRDSVQHSYFEPLHEWGRSIRHFYFGSHMGKESLAVIAKDQKIDFNPKDTTTSVIQIFRRGTKECGKKFKKAILEDMAAIDYPLKDIGVTPVTSIVVHSPMAGEVVCLFVKEKDLKGVTEQTDMSQGMFRTLSIIIQLNYSQMTSRPSCILIDDIGEGLDFDRSCALIELLMRKVKGSSVQLIMATNDRFVMNKVPLETWAIIRRKAGTVEVFNYANSQKIFDEFKFTGLNNFDFYATKFMNEARMNA